MRKLPYDEYKNLEATTIDSLLPFTVIPNSCFSTTISTFSHGQLTSLAFLITRLTVVFFFYIFFAKMVTFNLLSCFSTIISTFSHGQPTSLTFLMTLLTFFFFTFFCQEYNFQPSLSLPEFWAKLAWGQIYKYV